MDAIYAQGVKQGDFVDLLALIKTNFNAILTKLDADGGVSDTDFNSLWAITLPDGIQTTHPKAIRSQGDVVSFLNTFITNFNAVMTKLDLDGTVNGTDYSSALAITDIVGANIDPIQDNGLFDGAVIKLLDTIIARIASLNAKFDLDSGVSGTNYASLWNVTDTVDSSGAYLSYR